MHRWCERRGRIGTAIGTLLIAGSLADLPAVAAQTAPSPCAGDSVMKESLQTWFRSFDFTSDSAAIEFVKTGQRTPGIARAARRIVNAGACRRANDAWFRAVGGNSPQSPAEAGSTAVVRVGSFYLIAIAGGAEIVLADRRWRVLSVLGLDND